MEYALQSIRIPGSLAHPTKLVQSAAMASVAPSVPAYRPHLPAIVVTDGLLSDAQLESVVYAGEAHSDFLAGSLVCEMPKSRPIFYLIVKYGYATWRGL